MLDLKRSSAGSLKKVRAPLGKKRKAAIDGGEGETEKKKKKRKINDSKVGKTEKASALKKKKSGDKPETLKSKRVSFAGDVEVFPGEEHDDSDLVRGKRFSPEEDQMIVDAVYKYIETNQLGEKGLEMVLNCRKHPKVRGCWKEICTALPWRPTEAVYSRGHNIFERSEKRGFSKEEMEIIKKYHAENGPKWKKLAAVLGKQRIHIKDAWRRIRLPNMKHGRWSQEEYQTLFDMVNLDIKMKAFDGRKSDNKMIRENISWEAISDSISTRTMSGCCHKWYDQLTSPLVREGLWADADDYRLLDALENLDACNADDVDWDSLLDGRSGEVCQKRWREMIRHIGGFQEKSFIEQLDVLTKRYCGDIPQYRFKTEVKDEGEENDE